MDFFCRGYYRCSAVKGCPARKKVERARDDPAMLVVTYDGDHRHPPATVPRAVADASVGFVSQTCWMTNLSGFQRYRLGCDSRIKSQIFDKVKLSLGVPETIGLFRKSKQDTITSNLYKTSWWKGIDVILIKERGFFGIIFSWKLIWRSRYGSHMIGLLLNFFI